MALRADSYGSVAEVLTFTKHLMDGQSSFNSTTRPTLTEVEKIIDRASGSVNIALNNEGFTTPVTNTTAKLLLDDWVISQSVMQIELTKRGAGFSEEEASRAIAFRSLSNAASKFVKENALGLKRLGVGVSHTKSEGLTFTGLDDQDQRDDPDDGDLEQPMFTRAMFGAASNDEDED